MDIIVCMKQIPDLQQIRIKDRQPVLEGVPFLFGDMDKNALEEAVRINEQAGEGVITAVAIGAAKLKDTIKEALAIGADEAVLLTDPAFVGSDTIGSARTLAKAIEKIGAYDLILMGEGSTDDYSGQVPGRVAEMLGLPCVTTVRELEIGDGTLRAVRDMEEALEVVECPLPAVVGVTSEINDPRLPKLTQILKAGRKPTHTWGPDDIGLAAGEVGAGASVVEVISSLAPEQERKNVIFEEDVDDAVAKVVDAMKREGVLEA